MRTMEEIREYLGIEEDVDMCVLYGAEQIENIYKVGIEQGTIGYCLKDDFPSRVEDNAERIDGNNDIVVYKINKEEHKMNVFEMVMEYFNNEEAVKNYEPVGVTPTDEENIYRVMAQYIGDVDYKKNTFSVWTCFNTETQSMNYGHYDMQFEVAYQIFTLGHLEEYKKEDLLTMLGDACKEMIAWDEDDAYNFFENNDIDDELLRKLDIAPRKKFKTVRVEATVEIEVVIPQDEDEDYFDYDEYIQDCVSEASIYTYVEEENISEKRANELVYNGYFGEV